MQSEEPGIYCAPLTGGEGVTAEISSGSLRVGDEDLTSTQVTATAVEYSVHPPNKFLSTHVRQLLPDWAQPVGSVVVVLQQSLIPLLEKSSTIEAEKARLRQRFLDFGTVMTRHLQVLGFASELFDPQDGHPLLSRSGSLHLDDLAVIKTVLGYQPVPQGGCLVMEHPRWGKAVYPSILVSTAPPEAVEQVLIGLVSSGLVPQQA